MILPAAAKCDKFASMNIISAVHAWQLGLTVTATVINSRVKSTGDELVTVLVYEATTIGSDEATARVLCQDSAHMQAKPEQRDQTPTTSGHALSRVRR